VLVASWLARRPDLSPAWVTFDPGDNDPVRLWTYVAYAVDRLQPGIAGPALARLRSPRSVIENAIDELLNGLAGCEGRVVVVLDDLHHVQDESALRTLAYAVEQLPSMVRVVAIARHPAWPPPGSGSRARAARTRPRVHRCRGGGAPPPPAPGGGGGGGGGGPPPPPAATGPGTEMPFSRTRGGYPRLGNTPSIWMT
jgi:hypothetical protein